MAELVHIEHRTEEALISERGGTEGKAKFAAYVIARDCLIKEVLPEIKGVDWALTDHGVSHVTNVLQNAAELLGADIDYTGTELYCLALSILFHDVGNVFGDRKTHQHNITQVYEFVRPEAERGRQEQYIIQKTAGAHCGSAADGSRDTLKFLESTTQLDGRPVRLRELAAVLRLADELAEGPQRTSLFMQHRGKYPRGSTMYHEYAQATGVCIDRANERIALTFNIDVNASGGKLTKKTEQWLAQFLEFVYERVMKLEQERRYTRYYCDALLPLKRTTIALNFWLDGQHSDLGLGSLPLNDLVVPGDPHKPVVERNSAYRPKEIITAIQKLLKTKGPLS